MKEDILDKYALQILSDADKIWLQKALKADPSFQKELDLHTEIVRGIEIHTEKLFDIAFVELNAMADETLKNSIEEVEKTLEQENFFAPILIHHVINQPIETSQTPVKEEQIVNTHSNQIINPKLIEELEIASKKTEPKEDTHQKTKISVLANPEKEISNNTSTPPKDWVKIIAILLVILLTILLLYQNL